MKGRNTKSTPNLVAISKYGDFSLVGFGCETKIFLIIGVLKIYVQTVACYDQCAPKGGYRYYFKGTKVQNYL